MDFEWDPEKARRNLAVHRVSFEDASTAFGDPLSVTIDDPDHSYGEQRLLLLGETYSGTLVVVAHVLRGETGETVRLISARVAERHERRTYEEG
jgi:hypothetical protein